MSDSEQATADMVRVAEERRRGDQVRAVMSSAEGRRFLMEVIFDVCGVLHASMVAGDPLGTAYAEGRRSCGLALLVDVDRWAPELLLLARREQLDLIEEQRHLQECNKQENGNV